MAAKKVSKDAAPPTTEIPTLVFATKAAWAAWLGEHHATSQGVWVKMAKKGSGEASLDYPQALDAALAYGWIDSHKTGIDDVWWRQKFTPRRARSIWSKINTDKALALIASGEMQPAGLVQVERAKADGRWAAAYDGQKKSQLPEDLAAAIAANPKAAEFYATLNSANRFAIIFRTGNVKTPATRAKKIAQFVEMLARNEKLHA